MVGYYKDIQRHSLILEEGFKLHTGCIVVVEYVLHAELISFGGIGYFFVELTPEFVVFEKVLESCGHGREPLGVVLPHVHDVIFASLG